MGAEGMADIPLWIGVDQKHALATRRQTRRHVDCSGRLPHAALHVHYGDLAHRLSEFRSSKQKWRDPAKLILSNRMRQIVLEQPGQFREQVAAPVEAGPA